MTADARIPAVEDMSLSDEEVVRRVLGGERGLFEILMRRYNQRLFRIARAVLSDAVEAEDVMQDAYVRAYQHLEQFDGRAKFSTWLSKIALHEALARRRRRQRFVELEDVLQADKNSMITMANTPNPEQTALTRTLSGMLEAAIDTLPQAYRTVFVLRDVESLNTTETAESLGISEATVKVRLHRARAMLRREIYERTGAASAAAFEFMGERCDRMVAVVLAEIQKLPVDHL